MAKKKVTKKTKKKPTTALMDMIASDSDEVMMIGNTELVKNNTDLQTAFRVVTEQYLNNLKKMSEASGTKILVKTILDIQ